MSELVSVLGVAGITEAELLVAASTFDDDGSDIPGRNPSLFALATGIVTDGQIDLVGTSLIHDRDPDGVRQQPEVAASSEELADVAGGHRRGICYKNSIANASTYLINFFSHKLSYPQ